MAKYIVELMDDINNDPSILKTKLAGNAAMKVIFENAFIPEMKWMLPEGDAPYNPTPEPLGMTPTNLYTELRRFYIFRREDLADVRRESIFITLLEGVHESEAKLLVAIKDQKLTDLYPNITAEVVADAGFIPAPAKPAAKKKTTKKKATGSGTAKKRTTKKTPASDS